MPRKGKSRNSKQILVAYNWRWAWGMTENGQKGSFWGCQKHSKTGFGDIIQPLNLSKSIKFYTENK